MHKMFSVIILAIFAQIVVDANLFKDVNIALDKSIGYIKKYHVNFNIDGYFGVTIALGQLEKILEEQDPLPPALFSKLIEQIIDLRNILNNGQKSLQIRNSRDQLFIDLFLNKNKWKKNNFFNKTVVPPNSNPLIPKLVASSDDYEYFVSTFEGFDEDHSDQCMEQLIKSSFLGKNCKLRDHCLRTIKDPKIIPAYNVSHRLLFLLVADSLGCQWNKEEMKQLKKQFCSYMYWESVIMGPLKLRKDFGDLFMEDVILCGMEGYADFLRSDWIDQIVKSQSAEGCYFSQADNYRKRKREANEIAFGCSDHSTGIGMGVLGLCNRYLMQLQNFNTKKSTSYHFKTHL